MGMTMKEVAQSLNVSVSTVNTYSNSLYRKLKVYSRAQLLLKCHKLIGN
jgi:DNA-binding NarL/FixJ family response regulator